MHFELSLIIQRCPNDVFRFLRDKDKYPQEPGSPVLVLEQITPGPVGVGTRYREVVRMFPFIRGQFLSLITRYEPGRYLEEDFEGAGMVGHLAYRFLPEAGGTRLIQCETIRTQGLMRLFEPIMARMLSHRLDSRLRSIKAVLESGWAVSEP